MHVKGATLATCVALLLAWSDQSDNEDGFAIERLAATGWTEIARTAANVQQYKDETPTEGCYRVRAFNSIGYSEYSNTACFLKAPVSLSIK